MSLNNINDEWDNFISNDYIDDDMIDELDKDVDGEDNIIKTNIFDNIEPPEPTDIYISTKSKIAYLTEPVDLSVFWKIPIVPYSMPIDGVIKKEIKINSTSQEQIDFIQENLKKELYFKEKILTSINNPSGRIKFKDIRKITIGICKKDIICYRSKEKQAFYNCFVMILRIKDNDEFKEFHIKIFNTGKLEIPGVQNEVMLEKVLNYIINILQPHSDIKLTYKQKSDTVLINSNFNCGFYIDREVLFDILRNKYNIQAIYDPCSYPGIQCKFYYNDNTPIQSGVQISEENKHLFNNISVVSFMIFRTGSVLIVGMCEDNVLMEIYAFLKNLLKTEFKNICQKLIAAGENNKNKNKKIRKKMITLTNI